MSVKYTTRAGDTVASIAWRKYGTSANRVVEKLLEANPGLAARGSILPAGVVVELPVITAAAISSGIKLWK